MKANLVNLLNAVGLIGFILSMVCCFAFLRAFLTSDPAYSITYTERRLSWRERLRALFTGRYRVMEEHVSISPSECKN